MHEGIFPPKYNPCGYRKVPINIHTHYILHTYSLAFTKETNNGCMIIICPEKLAYFPSHWCMCSLVLGVSLVGFGGHRPWSYSWLPDEFDVTSQIWSWVGPTSLDPSFGDPWLSKCVLFHSLISVYLECHLERLIKRKVFLALDSLRKLLEKNEGICISIWEKEIQLESQKKYVQLYTLDSLRDVKLYFLCVIFASLTISKENFPDFWPLAEASVQWQNRKILQ